MRTHFLLPTLLLVIPLLAMKQISAQPSWRQIGKAGEWSNTVMLRNMNGVFYSIESDGTLYATTLNGSSYTSRIIGEANTYYGTKLFAVMDGMIYNVQNGILYETDPRDGTWREVSTGWNYTKAMACMGGYVWSLEQNGTLYRSELNGNYVQVGATNALPDVDFMTAMGGKLYALQDGTMYMFNPASVKWQVFGEKDDYWESNYLFATRSYLWVLFDSGDLDRIDANDNETTIGSDYSDISLLDVMGDAVYAVKDGTLYRTR